VIPCRDENLHVLERHLLVAQSLGWHGPIPGYQLAPREEEIRNLEDLLKAMGLRQEGRLVVIHPGAGWISRRWPKERYAELIRRLAKRRDLTLILVGGPEGGASENEVFEHIRESCAGDLLDLSGRISLRMLMALLVKAHLFIGNEAGPLHLAGALGIPSVALLGPTRRFRTGPYSAKARVIQKMVPCAPCRNRSCKNRVCMEEISVEEVYQAVGEKLAETGPPDS
jgi:ADP-heptose:LPS heptosyltransferase